VRTQPAYLYGHGFASSPDSKKGRALAAHFQGLGILLERLDLVGQPRNPSFEHLRLSAMMKHVQDQIGGERDRAVLMGSSLGGLTMARVAEKDARCSALVLLAPAFRLAERWRARLGDKGWNAWRDTGFLEVVDLATSTPSRVDFGFVQELEALDQGLPDVRVPTLVIQGVRDDVVNPDLSRAFAKGKRHVRLIEVDDDHELALSIPVIQKEIQDFLRNWMAGP
jgi:pimeloyl-ACP methyl ester carboxylesterase